MSELISREAAIAYHKSEIERLEGIGKNGFYDGLRGYIPVDTKTVDVCIMLNRDAIRVLKLMPAYAPHDAELSPAKAEDYLDSEFAVPVNADDLTRFADAINAAQEEFRSVDTGTYDIKRAIEEIAALRVLHPAREAAPAVKVKALVWARAPLGRAYGGGDGILYWVNSKLCVLFKTTNEIDTWEHLPSGAHPRASLDAAKAAAQADYEARVLSALEIPQ